MRGDEVFYKKLSLYLVLVAHVTSKMIPYRMSDYLVVYTSYY